jgi:tetratricopeptide (TPR) repeat protein
VNTGGTSRGVGGTVGVIPHGRKGHVGEVWKGQALLAQGQGEQAEAALSQALTVAQEIGNPPQLWKTYQALGELYERQADLERARAAYRSAMEVIEGVAARLQNQELRRTFLDTRPVQELRTRLTEMKPA